ncbi:MAG: hypothetical protein OEV06_03750, partial [Anaerolineae bacterium]|nr:hypothetical protein [Anaerolineae bacterium]
ISDLASIVAQPVSVIDGAKPVAKFTPRETEIIRLGLLFNLTHRDVADELVVSPIWVSEVISNAYEKLGLRELVSGEFPVEEVFEDPAVAERIHSLLARPSKTPGGKQLRKTPWVSTLAFHMLTVPEVEKITAHPP